MPELARALGCQVSDLSPEYASAGRDASLPSIPIVGWGDLVGGSAAATPKEHVQLSMLDGRFVIAVIMPDGSADRIAAEGDTVFVDTADIGLRHGEPYLFVHEGAPTLRIYRKLPDRMQPASTSLDFETQYCTATTRVVGRVRLSVKVL
ncbi:hypothetical protein [Rhizobium sp. BK176]|uniref:hypothetical protein n=1 Tax=Rhizobium sp. BK176 TaxID=2587071 RepID=UPI002169FAE6|nr:hypothetical protein [Rhizobium sp. BK176]MCS4089950.1 hypothetical protein [Rhizobium sp. BK176]